jgi:hypothetical protein
MVTGRRGVKHGQPANPGAAALPASPLSHRNCRGIQALPRHNRRELRRRNLQKVPPCMAKIPQERPSGPRDWFHMETADQYRTFAEECERLARRAEAEHQRNILLEMAKTWRLLAQETERNATG